MTAPTLVISTRDRTVRTGVGSSVSALFQGITAYLADGYTLDELILEGLAEE